jgi:DNA ligase-1
MTAQITRPMLAANVDILTGALDKLRFPLLVTPKLDGIRCVMVDGKALSRTFKPIPNRYIREWLEGVAVSGLDGELMMGDGLDFQATTSAIMSRDGSPDFTYHVFDFVSDSIDTPYNTRLVRLAQWVGALQFPHIKFVPYQQVDNLDELLAFEAEVLKMGYEGVCMRSPDSPYKCGRATFKQQWLLKMKRFLDGEATILGFVERMQNTNEAVTNELGLTKRSSAKSGKVPAGTLGTFQVRDLADGTEFEIGTGRGLGDALRKAIWQNQDAYLGRVIKFKYQPQGVKDAPRVASFLGFRDAADMGEPTC